MVLCVQLVPLVVLGWGSHLWHGCRVSLLLPLLLLLLPLLLLLLLPGAGDFPPHFPGAFKLVANGS